MCMCVERADSIILRLQRDWRLAGRLAGFDRHCAAYVLYVAVVILGDPFKYDGINTSESVNDLIARRILSKN